MENLPVFIKTPAVGPKRRERRVRESRQLETNPYLVIVPGPVVDKEQ
jgi:hypothetical protein